MLYRYWLLVLIMSGEMLIFPATLWASLSPNNPTLAEYVPGNVQFFWECRDLASLDDTPVASVFASMLADLIRPYNSSPTTQPAREPDLSELIAQALNLPTSRTVKLLFNGPLAIAAYDINRIQDAILLIEPRNPAAVEAQLSTLLITESGNRPVRRYRLSRKYEMVCDGKRFVIGILSKRSSLYARTVDLLVGNRGIVLSDLLEFRERIAALPADSQMVLYVSSGRTTKPEEGLMSNFWPAHWPHLVSVAVGMVITDTGIIIETTGRLNPKGPKLGTSDPPIPTLILLPASTVLAWTHAINYVDEFKRLDVAYPKGIIRFYIDLLQSGLAPGELEQKLFSHLIGDTIFLIGQVEKSSTLGDKSHRTPLLLPVGVIVVEAVNPQAVEDMLNHVGNNFLRLLNLQRDPENPLRIHTESLGKERGTIHTIPMGSLFEAYSQTGILTSLEISWTVADHMMIIGTHSDTVRQIIQACRGEYPWISDETFLESMHKIDLKGGVPKNLLVAQPKSAGEMIDSWLTYASDYYPQMFEPDWWQKLRRQQRAAKVQLGIIPVRHQPLQGKVQVAKTLPAYPAHTRLKPGDQIISVDGQKLQQTDAMQSLRMLVAMRKREDRVRLEVIRGGEKRVVVIDMPDERSTLDHIQPVILFKRAINFMRMFSTASHIIWQPSPDLVNTRLQLRFTGRATSQVSDVNKP
ncbi:MAG: PDZ domain-containing protein [Planctomycetota bacterium]|nr:MAG: PDZ domain-containing protein [Planctomycetota bacterium]